MKHPKFPKDPIWLEVKQANWAMPFMAILTTPISLAEVCGATCHSLLHAKCEANYGQFFTFLDRLCGRYRKPDAYLFEKQQKMSAEMSRREASEV